MLDHSRLQELFLAACDLPETQQQEMLDAQCSDDAELRKELQLLLRTDARKDGIFADDKTTDGIQFQFDTVVEAELPKQIGRYRVKKILGQGGMGVVYLAQQQNPRRDVAVKVIRSGMVSPDLLKRFELEAAVLGRLAHPGIANIYEAGVFVESSTNQERPFLAMEYIEGQPLREFVKTTKPDKVQRLRLLVQVCEAVHHAHQRGVIHRDLKPGNVMVKADAQPSILDFGVARATGMDPGMSTLQTRAGQLIGTLPYMSPEQVTGHSLDVDTRSDVYSLGVIAYELLSGKLPNDVEEAEYLKAAKAISEDPPMPLSSFGREFRGDLNTVVLKALEKEPDRRYQSTKAFGDDVQRYLDNRPVVARPATTWYQLRQFSKRNKALVAGFLVSIALLVGGVIGTTRGMINAQQEASRKNAVNEFMKDILIAEDSESGNPNIKMMEVLREAAANAPKRFQEYPELEAEVNFLLATAFTKLTLYADALPLHRRAYETRKANLGLSHVLTRQAGAGLANLLANNDARGTIELANTLLENTPPDDLNSQDALRLQLAIARAHIRLFKVDVAEQEFREILANLPEPGGAMEWETKVRLAEALGQKVHFGLSDNEDRDVGEAIKLFRSAIAESNKDLGEGHSRTLNTMYRLAQVLRRDANELAEAEELCRQVIDQASSQFDAEHFLNVRPHLTLSKICYLQDSYHEAAEFLVKGIALRRKGAADDMGIFMRMTDGLPIIEAAGRFVEGEEFTRILLEKFGSRGGIMEPTYRLYLARFLSGQGRTAEAKIEFDEVAAADELDSDFYLQCVFNLFLGEHELAFGDRVQAAEMFDKAKQLHQLHSTKTFPRIARIEDSIKRANLSVINEN